MVAAEEGEGCALRVRGAEAVDVVRIPLFAFRFYMGDCAFQVRAPARGREGGGGVLIIMYGRTVVV